MGEKKKKPLLDYCYQYSSYYKRRYCEEELELTAGLHALADALYTVQVGQFLVGQKSLRDGRVEAACHATALSGLVLERDLDAVHSHGCAGAAAAKVRVELTHGLLDELITVTVHLQGQIT